eukprot:5317168-Amphidinium_carterae.1
MPATFCDRLSFNGISSLRSSTNSNPAIGNPNGNEGTNLDVNWTANTAIFVGIFCMFRFAGQVAVD